MSGATRERRVDDAFDPLCEEIGIKVDRRMGGGDRGDHRIQRIAADIVQQDPLDGRFGIILLAK